MEILSAIMIVAVVVSISLPAANNFFSSQQVAFQAFLLLNDIRLARACAIENQGYTRLVFNPDKTRWVVQELTDGSGNAVQGEFFGSFGQPPTDYQEEPTNWRSLLDGPTREIDTEVEMSLNPPAPAPVFFRSDGMLVASPSYEALPIRVQIASFTYGQAVAQVDITPAGGLESIEYYREDY